jgi:hypothetical protein
VHHPRWKSVTVPLFLVVCARAFAGPATTVVNLSADATIRSAGVEVTITGDDNGDATAMLEYKDAADAGWTEGHPASAPPGLSAAPFFFSPRPFTISA